MRVCLSLFLFSFLALTACSSTQGPADAGATDTGIDHQGLELGSDTGTDARPPTPGLRVDGRFADWGEIVPAIVDPKGDARGVFDIARVYLASEGTHLFVRLALHDGEPLNLQNGPARAGTLVLEIGVGEKDLKVDFRGRSAQDGDANAYSWRSLRMRAAPTVAATEFELRLDLAAVGATAGDTVSINFSGNDTLEASLSHELKETSSPRKRRDSGRRPHTSFRIASLNTFKNGLIDPLRGHALGRLISAVKADILCFQEEFLSTDSQIKAALESLDPLGDGMPFNVHRNASNLIASPLALRPLPASNQNFAMAAVDANGHGAWVVVLSIRPDCCGYIGSVEDNLRLQQVRGMVEAINGLRAGTLSASALDLKDAPVVVIGDWNYVGSPTPLTLFEEPSGPALRHWMLPHLVGEDIVTWHSGHEGPGAFISGMLDLLAYSPKSLQPANGFVLDSRELAQEELAALGLRQQDSAASDHLMLVGDFQLMGSWP